MLLKIDFSNAFNSIRRDTLLETVYQRYPSVYNYTLAAYGDASFLMFGDETLLSDEGVQQGDPDGPRLFGDTINSFIQSLQSRFNVWYLDDGNLADEYQIVLGDLRDVIEEGGSVGSSSTRRRANSSSSEPSLTSLASESLASLVRCAAESRHRPWRT